LGLGILERFTGFGNILKHHFWQIPPAASIIGALDGPAGAAFAARGIICLMECYWLFPHE
jgi:hypothetical protein